MLEFDIVKHFRRFNSHGNGAILKGRPRSGKTTLVGILTNILLEDGFFIITTVRFSNEVLDKFRGRIFYVSNDIEYLWAYINIPDDAPLILFFDDAQANQGMTSKGVLTKEGHNLAVFLIFIGKLETNYFYVAHQKYLPAPLIEGFNPIMLYTLDLGKFYLSDKVLLDERLIQRYGYEIDVPDRETYGLPIISRAVARFRFLLDWEDLTDYLAREEVGDNLKGAIREYLEKERSKISREPNDLEIAQQLKSLSYEKILLALSMKKGRKLSKGETLGDLFNPMICQMVRTRMGELGFTDKGVKKKKPNQLSEPDYLRPIE